MVSAAEERAPPYWASISASAARMRTGPGEQYPASWLYNRAGLPVLVIQTYPDWRRIRDPDGTEGWVFAKLLSSKRTAMVMGAVRELRASPDTGRNRALARPAGRDRHGLGLRLGLVRAECQRAEGLCRDRRALGVDPGETLK